MISGAGVTGLAPVAREGQALTMFSEQSDKVARFTGKVTLVTGGNSGIGFAIATRFAREGAHVVIVARNATKGAAAVKNLKALGAEAEFWEVDLTCEDAVAKAVAKLDRLDVLVNNAGVVHKLSGVAPEDTPGQRWDKWRGPNLDAAYYMIAHCLPLLRASGGSVVNISSTATLHGNWGLYGVTKAATEALTRSFAVEAAPVRVNAVSPGWVATDAVKDAAGAEGAEWDVPPSLFNRMGEASEIAAAVAFLASDDASFITGQTLIVDGGLTVVDYPSRALLEDVGGEVFSTGHYKPKAR